MTNNFDLKHSKDHNLGGIAEGGTLKTPIPNHEGASLVIYGMAIRQDGGRIEPSTRVWHITTQPTLTGAGHRRTVPTSIDHFSSWLNQ